MRNDRMIVGVIIIIVAIGALVGGAMYLTIPGHSLPSFFPTHTGLGKHTKKGEVGVGVGVVLMIIGIAVLATGRRRRRRY